MAKFRVDTHLFRELGELLVGRNSTALAELIKNAYDADALQVTVTGKDLSSLDDGKIVITDDGNGMTAAEFKSGFLTIAGRNKDEGLRKSKKFKRRYTGMKGIGRLAAHKLARRLAVQSAAFNDDGELESISAEINWDKIEKAATLDELDEKSISLDSEIVAQGKTGTTIALRRLRRAWTPTEISLFVSEASTLEPPSILVNPLSEQVVPETLLFPEPEVRDTEKKRAGFSIRLEGDFEVGEEYWKSIAEVATWVIEVNAAPGEDKVSVVVAPTVKTARKLGVTRVRRSSIEHPNPAEGPFFQARILIREGQVPPTILSWARKSSGIRVFMEGFRVLPYGEPGNDWLSIDYEYSRRSRGLGETDAGENQGGLRRLPNTGYFGAVFLTEKNSSGLRMLVNREGFVSGPAYENLTKILRKAIDFSVITRAAVAAENRRKKRESVLEKNTKKTATGQAVLILRKKVDDTVKLAARLYVLSKEKKWGKLYKNILRLQAGVDELHGALADVVEESAFTKVLASLGIQLSAFVHEVRSVFAMAVEVERAISAVSRESLSKNQRKELAHILGLMSDLRRALERQSAYLADVLAPDARRRRSAQNVRERFDAALSFVALEAKNRRIRVRNEIGESAVTRPMYRAEITAVFSNLLTNAVKAAGIGGKIRASGKEDSKGNLAVLVENTGSRVKLKSSERLFRPFVSTTAEANPTLGHGMGMGLPISRELVEEYGGELRFVEPSNGYATAIELWLPGEGQGERET